MPTEGTRLRLMEMAELKMPVTTPSTHPEPIPAPEERGISEAIAQNLAVMSRLKTPLICIVIGEVLGGAPGVGDHLAMVISPY